MFVREILHLAAIGLVVVFAKNLVERFDTRMVIKGLGKLLMSIPKLLMMVLMALPEQFVLARYEPNMSLVKRLLVSIAMYVVHFAWNGVVMKPQHSHNELVWILGTALFAYYGVGVKQQTAVALVAADSVMTLALRGLA